jgi:hypothetical protein
MSDVMDGSREVTPNAESTRRVFAGVAFLWALSGARSSDSFLPSTSYCRAPTRKVGVRINVFRQLVRLTCDEKR